MTTGPDPEGETATRPLSVAAGLLLAVLLFAGLGAAIVWAYFPVLDNGFVWDDGANLGTARASWDRGLRGAFWAFREPFNGHYQPLTWLSYQLDARLSGATPRGVHATNLLLHLAVTAMVAILAFLLAGAPALSRLRPADPAKERPFRVGLAWVAAAIFALHPIRVESVAWATERRDLLSTLFALAALALHLRTSPAGASPSPARGRVALLHALSALSRAQMTLPLVLLLLDVWPLGRLGGESDRARRFAGLVREKGLSFVVAAASAATAIWAQASSGALTAVGEHGALDRLVQAGYGLAFYPASLLFGRTWLPLYERPYPFDPTAPGYALPAVAAACALVGLWLLRRRVPSVAAAAGAYFLLVLPVLGIAQSGIQLVADRYAYLATVPLVLLAAGAGAAFWASLEGPSRVWAKGALVVALFALLTTSALETRRQTLVWQSDETLWRHVLSHSGSCLADNNLGYLLYARGEGGPALFHLVRSLERVPTYGRPWRGIVALLETPWPPGAPEPARVAETLERAAATQRGSTLPRYAAALAWIRAGDALRAEEGMREVLAREPGHDGARLALARLEAREASLP
ncbi:MAG: hypothetical protein IPP07_09890 [Holophagales bacterium]|nr:hypothetical protein [Holophagales bacterium]